MAQSAFTDPRVLVGDAYRDPAKLAARTAIYAYQTPRFDLVREVVGRLRGVAGPVLDVGCGPGRYTQALRAAQAARPVIACDLSGGMVSVAGPPAAVTNVSALPFRTDAFHAALALHMLYHVEHPDTALAELARVTAGFVLISTNADGHKRELLDVHAQAAADVGITIDGPVDTATRFNLDEAEVAARRHFRDVDRNDLIGTVAVPDAAPVVAFIASTAPWYGDSAASDAVLARVATRVSDIIARDGAFRFRNHLGFLACR
ncbi:MAG TPA: class I SAM-dependent methyltransferase [Micromonosporaceae bacterium]|jgi:SAM-dependent methyltransferase|nr:class I SAM-dependent methyltransferase [Micromonosporaceae bacterium]